MGPSTIYCIVDRAGWVQHRRVGYLKQHQNKFRLQCLSPNTFHALWRLGLLRKRPLFFTTWRILHKIQKTHSGFFRDDDFRYIMAAVTSHSNIGGGLDPNNPIPNRTPEEALELAVDLLRRCKVVTVNSLTLQELLEKAIPQLLYCPNGVDEQFFSPARKRPFDPSHIHVGWIGKVRGPKNVEVIERAAQALVPLGVRSTLVKIPRDARRPPLDPQRLRDFYRSLDFYICASWNEGTPNPSLEAGSCGVPVVTTRVGNMRELIRHKENGYFIEPTVESIVSMLKNAQSLSQATYEQMSQCIRTAITSEWSWDNRIINFLRAFERLTDP